MTITLGPELETALNEQARKQGVVPEALALDALRERFLAARALSHEDWAKRLREVGSDCGTSLSHEAVSSEGIYE